MNNFKNILLPVCSLVFFGVFYYSSNSWKHSAPEESEVNQLVQEIYGPEHTIKNSSCQPDEQVKRIRCDYTLFTTDKEGNTSQQPSYGLFKKMGDSWEAILY